MENTYNLYCLCVLHTIGVESQRLKSTFVIFQNSDTIHNRGVMTFFENFSMIGVFDGPLWQNYLSSDRKEPPGAVKDRLNGVE